MKRLTHISLLIATSFMLSCGGTAPSPVTPDNVRKAAATACAGVAIFVPASELTKICDYMWSIAHGIRTFEGGRVPTPQEMQDMIAQFAPNGAGYAQLGAAVSLIWGGIYPYLGGDVKLGLTYLEALAGGFEDFAVKCRTSTPTPIP